MTVVNAVGKCVRTSASTSRERLVRVSTIVSRMPRITRRRWGPLDPDGPGFAEWLARGANTLAAVELCDQPIEVGVAKSVVAKSVRHSLRLSIRNQASDR